MSSGKPVRLEASFQEKPWGATDLAPWFESPGNKVGEVWFKADHPLLVKYLFTTDRLSVQVHPEDAFAVRHENSRGKTEMWHILRAEPGAQIAVGFRESMTQDRLRRTAQSGEIVDLLNWIDVQAGETFFTPAGTVHAIGVGLALCEIQQHSNVTYRIYDYGSDRELHLEKAIQVCDLSAMQPRPSGLPVECEYFTTDALLVDCVTEFEPKPNELLIFHQGEGTIAGERYRLGETWLVPADRRSLLIDPAKPTKLLRTSAPPGRAH